MAQFINKSSKLVGKSVQIVDKNSIMTKESANFSYREQVSAQMNRLFGILNFYTVENVLKTLHSGTLQLNNVKSAHKTLIGMII